MKRILLSFVLLVGTAYATFADTYNYLTLVSTDLECSVALKSIKRITFEGGNLVVTSVDGTETNAALSTLSSITFTVEATAVRGINAHRNDLCIEAGQVVANGTGMLLLYNANGHVVRQEYVDSQRAEISLRDLPRGIYIARLGNQTLKIAH